MTDMRGTCLLDVVPPWAGGPGYERKLTGQASNKFSSMAFALVPASSFLPSVTVLTFSHNTL